MADVDPKARRRALGPTGEVRDEGGAGSNSVRVMFPMGATSDDTAAACLVDAPCCSGVTGVESSDESVAAAVECGASAAARGAQGAAVGDGGRKPVVGIADSSRGAETAHAAVEAAAAAAPSAAENTLPWDM